MSDDWQPIETAPRTGQVILTYFIGVPTFIAWTLAPDDYVSVKKGWWIFKTNFIKKVPLEALGWRVVIYSHRIGIWAIDGSFGPVSPSHWMPLPRPPK